MKTKTKILAFVSLILSVIFIGTGFSIFVFANKINEHTDYAKGLMDDIDVNYKLDANAYTVYFFSFLLRNGPTIFMIIQGLQRSPWMIIYPSIAIRTT